jgi:hypothetical protein
MSTLDRGAVTHIAASWPRLRALWPCWLFLLTLAGYGYTLTPSIAWADGARLQMDVMLRGSTYWFFDEARQLPTDGWPFDRLGVAAWDHPLYVMLGQLMRLLPWGEPAWRITLLSALAGSLAVTLLALVALRLTGDLRAATLGALALAVAHTFWFHAVTPEVYTLHAVFMLSLIGLALRWSRRRDGRDLLLFALLAGLGCANHIMLALTLLPTLILIGVELRWPASARRERGPTGWPLAASMIGLFALGFAPWWIQFGRMARVGGVWLTLGLATGFPWLPQRMPHQLSWSILSNLGAYCGLLLYQFTPLGLALGVCGARRLWRTQTRAGRLLAALFAIHALFSANYRVADRFAFHLPSYVIFALWIAAGWAGLLQALQARGDLRARARAAALALTLLPIPLYAATPRVVHGLGYTDADLGIAPIGVGARDALAYFFDPNQRGDDSAARFGRSTLAQLGPHALVFTAWPGDQEAYVVLRYVQAVERRRPDVQLDLLLFAADQPTPERVLAAARAQQRCRPLYLASLSRELYPLDELRREFTITPEANLYRLLPRQAAPSAICPPAQPRQLTLDQLIRSALR